MSALGPKLRQVEGGGLMFWCPGCDGAHMVRVGDGPGPRWSWNGAIERPTFAPSVFVNAPGPHHSDRAPICHFFVVEGRMKFLADCTHALAGQTVDLPDWETG